MRVTCNYFACENITSFSNLWLHMSYWGVKFPRRPKSSKAVRKHKLMNIATLALIKKSLNLVKVGIEYVEHDNQVSLGLRRPQWIGFKGPGIGRGNFDNGILKISSDVGGDTVRLDAAIFRAIMRIWNGPDGIKNTVKDGRLEASLWHDLVWYFAKNIAAAWGCSVLEVLDWANGLFHAAWKEYGEMYPSAKFVPQKARVAYGVTHFAAPWYHRFKQIFGLSLVVLCICGGCQGCALFEPPPDIWVTGSSGTFDNSDVEAIEPWISTNIVDGVR